MSDLFARWGLIFLAWWVFGNAVVIRLAGIHRIPAYLYEAADIDGAGFWRKTWNITLPAMLPVIYFNLIMALMIVLAARSGWIGSLQLMGVPSVIAGAFNVFLLRQFFLRVPKDISDAARIDGCSEFQIFLRIILPLCRPALLAVALFQLVITWNDFLGPLIYLKSQEGLAPALALKSFQNQNRLYGSQYM